MRLARLPLLLALPFAVIAAACSAPSSASDEPSGDEAEVREGGVCSTLDYGHEQSNADYFQSFADDASAKEYATDFLASLGKPPFKEISHDARLVRLVDEVYAGFKKVFPKETAGFDAAPRIVVVESDEVNAFAGFDDRPEVLKAPWLFFVHSSILAREFDDAQLKGLFVHELAHLLLRNVLPETRAKIRVHYRGKSIGNIAEDDATIRARAEEIRALGEKVGRFSELGALPLGIFSQTEYQQIFSWFRSQRATSAAPEACAASDDAFGRLMTLVQSNASTETYSLVLDDAQRQEVKSLVAEARAALAKCYGHVKGSLLEVKVRAKLAAVPPEQSEPVIAKLLDPATPEHAQAVAELLPDPIERDIDNVSPNLPDARSGVDRMLEVIEKLHAHLADLEKNKELPIDSIRIFDFEEDADDAAVRVLRAIGDDPLANGKFLLTMVKDADTCVRDVEAGKEPTYGRFVDPHNGTCWRYWHTVQLAKALEKCPGAAAGDTKTRAAKGTGEKSAADKAPSELLEKGRAVLR